MSNSLVEKITQDADAHVGEIDARAEADIAKIQADNTAAIDALKTAEAAKLDKEVAQQELVMTSKARQEARMKVQAAKRAQIDAVFAEVVTELAEKESAAYVTFFTERAKNIVADGVEVVRVVAPEKRQAETKEILGNLNLSADVAVDNAIAAGFVLTAKDGVYDVTLKRLVSDARTDLEMRIATELTA